MNTRTDTNISFFALLATCALAAALAAPGNAHALLVHAPYTPLSVTVVEPESNVFDSSASVDYNEFAILGYRIDAPGVAAGESTYFSNQHAKIKFSADPGHVLTWIDMDMSYVYRTAYSLGAYAVAGTWTISDGTYTGPMSFDNGDINARERWAMNGLGGEFYYDLGYNWSGGDRNGRRFTGAVIQLPNVTEVTVNFDFTGYLRSESFYGSTLYATLGFADAPPPPLPQDNQVPEPSTLLLAMGGLGAMALARRRKLTGAGPRTAALWQQPLIRPDGV